jgi:hypothetical protein
LLTINRGHTLLVTEPDGRIPWPTKDGFFVRDTRLISVWEIYANGYGWELLNSGAVTHFAARVVLTNPTVVTEDGSVEAGALHLQLARSTDEGAIHKDIDITNYRRKPVRFNLEIAIRSDFFNRLISR